MTFLILLDIVARSLGATVALMVTVALIVLLIAREMVTCAPGTATIRVRKALNVVVVPLFICFMAIVVIKLASATTATPAVYIAPHVSPSRQPTAIDRDRSTRTQMICPDKPSNDVSSTSKALFGIPFIPSFTKGAVGVAPAGRGATGPGSVRIRNANGLRRAVAGGAPA